MNNEFDHIVIGGGLAGISIALRLRNKGHSVLLLEQNKSLGGKMDSYRWKEFRWDMGPSLFTEPELFTDLFRIYGEDPSTYFKYESLDENCRYFFKDEEKLIMHVDKNKRMSEIHEKVGDLEAIKVEKYLDEALTNYRGFGKVFIDNPKPNIRTIFNPKVITYLPKLFSKMALSSLHDYNSKRFEDERLIKVFNRFATYNGSSPYLTSGIYNMISSVELKGGTFFPKKGMNDIIQSLVKLGEKYELKMKTNVSDINAVKQKSGYQVSSSIGSFKSKNLICAIDPISFYKYVLNDEQLLKHYKGQERSSSGLVFYWAIDKKIDDLGLHNIFFTDHYRLEFQSIFGEKKMSKELTIYVHVSSVINQDDAPSYGQNLFVMVNVPANIEFSDAQINEVKGYILQTLNNQLNENIENHIIHEKTWSPKGIHDDTGSFLGAIYGASSNGFSSALKRHGNTINKYNNLYFCGGAVHPGGGIPLVLRSSRIVSDLIG